MKLQQQEDGTLEPEKPCSFDLTSVSKIHIETSPLVAGLI